MNINNMGDLLRNAGKIRKEIERVQEELKERVVEGSAADGLVKVLVNGQQEILKVTISPKAVSQDPKDIELLEDLIVAAISQGVEKAKAVKNHEISKVTGGFGEALSGLFF
jgi:hypothetical protein